MAIFQIYRVFLICASLDALHKPLAGVTFAACDFNRTRRLDNSDQGRSRNNLYTSAVSDEFRSSLTYHTKEHSDDVTEMAIALGAADQLDEHSLLLLGIAAAYHDAGFIEHRADHEIVSADLAGYAMKSDGRFSQDDIELIHRMILDTKLQPDGPSHAISSSLSAWLVDADLANLGRSDFLEQTKLLAEELTFQ